MPTEAIKAGNECLADRTSVPGAPLWHMGQVAVRDSKESFQLLQNSIDYLTCKAQAKIPFTKNEKEFMKEIFEALWWGGKYHGYHEAAQLANHYVNGNGKSVSLSPEVYKQSVIVTDAIQALKMFIAARQASGLPFSKVSTGDSAFLSSAQINGLRQGSRNVNQQGYILKDGALLTEQNNLRLKNTDHRFYLTATTSLTGKKYATHWSVVSKYDFEPFDKHPDYITHIPLTSEFTLKLPDGLSEHLTKIGVAKDFTYGATWMEIWNDK